MRFTIPQPMLKGLVSVLSSVTSIAMVNCTEKGLETVCVDAAHVAMVGFTIPADALTGYEAADEFGMDLEKIQSFLKTSSPGDDIEVSIDDRLTMNSGNITRRMALIDISDIRTPNTIKTDADRLLTAIRGIQDLGDTITIKVKDGTFSMASEDELSSAEYDLTSKDVGVEINGIGRGAVAMSVFPKEYVISAIKSIPVSYKVTINLDNDYPVRIDFTDGTVSGFYFIAPRIDSEGSE
ncbi:hypothetical protein PED39_05265 [Methanomassiliicoccales archaeon LGM-RCC1]|nr:hypothetical protein PED39_05265 [Methanomassiliicoccales archaeon LGM-RCC1]